MKHLAIFLLLLVPVLASCSGDKDGQGGRQAAPVHVMTVQPQDVPRVLGAVGNVKASASVGLTPRVTGEIEKVHFTEGQDVKEGDVLLTIDTRPFEATLREKKGQLAKSEAQLHKATNDAGRYGKLVGNGYVSREAYEQTATEAAALRATVQADMAAVESAALDLSYCTLRAPISGRVGGLKVDKGNMVRSSDTTPIVSIDTLSPIYVTFSVPERHLSLILDRMHAGPVEVDVTPTGGQTEKGLLTLVENSVDTTTGTIQLRATFDNENRRLWPGQFVTVELPLGMARQALAIPSRAVQSGREENYLYVAGADGKASYRKVNILFESGDISVVEGELKAGEQVIIDGIVRLAPDVPVKVIQ